MDPNIYEALSGDTILESSDDGTDLFSSRNQNLFVDEYDMLVSKNNTLKVFPNFVCPSSAYMSDDNSLSSNSYSGSHLSVGQFTAEEISEMNMQESVKTFNEGLEAMYNDYIDKADEDMSDKL